MIYIDNIEKATLENTDYRRVVFTGKYSQLVLMSIPVGEEIDLEVHPQTDQFFRFERGQGELTIADKKYQVQDGSGVIVPHGVWHRLRNIGSVPLKLYTIYSPPHHPERLIQPVKSDVKPNNINLLIKLLLNL